MRIASTRATSVLGARSTPGLIVRDGAVERVLVVPDPAMKREDGDGGELGQDFASSGRQLGVD